MRVPNLLTGKHCAASVGVEADHASDTRRPATAIILVNWNNARDAIECLDSLIPTLSDGDHVFLVDNASTDDSLAVTVAWLSDPQPEPTWARPADIPSYCGMYAGQRIDFDVLSAEGQRLQGSGVGQLSVVYAGGNLGFAGGNNVGLRLALLASFTHFWLLNTDTVVRDDTLHELFRRLQQDGAIGIVGSTLVYYYQPDTVQTVGGHFNEKNASTAHIGQGWNLNCLPLDTRSVEAQMSYVVGASMLVTADFIREIGLMQEDYFLYFEELDWAMRARGKYKMAWAPCSLVFHKVGGSSAKPASAFSLDLLYRNQIRFVQRFMPGLMYSTLRRLVWETVRHVLRGRWKEAKMLAKVLLQRKELISSVTRSHSPSST